MSTRFYDTMTGLAPLHWWRFHEANAALEDDIGSDPDSPFTGSSGSITSQVAGPLTSPETTYGVSFASGAYLTRGANWSSNDFAGASDGTIVFFFKASSGSTTRFILGSHPDNYSFSFYLTTTGAFLWAVINGSNSRALTTDANGLDDNNWHMLAVTSDGSTANRIYIDGSEVTYSATTGGSSPPPTYFWIGSATAAGLFRVAQDPRYPTVGFDLPFVGAISELAFFSTALSASDVYSLWAASQPIPSTSPGAGGHRYKGRRTFAGF